MSSVREKARAAAVVPSITAAWGHVLGAGAFLIICLVIPPWPEAFAMPKAICVTITALVSVPLLWSRRTILKLERVPTLAAAGFAVVALLSQLLSGAPQAISLWGDWLRRAGLLTTLSLVVIFLAAATLTRPEVRALLAWIVWAGLPATVYGLVQLVGRDPIAWSDQGWILSTFGNPNFAAAGLAMLALLTAGIALVGDFKTPWRILMAPLAALEALLAVQTGSSLALFALAAGVTAGAAVSLVRWDHARRGLALIALGGAAALGFVLTLMALFGVGPLLTFISSDTLMFRRWYWGAAIGMATSHPVLGVGPDGYGRFYGQYRPPEALEIPGLGASAAHDVPLQWAATLGIPAALLYVGLVLTVAFLGVRRMWAQGPALSPLALPVAAAWTAYQVQSLVSIDAAPVAFLGWLSMGLLLAVTRPAQNPPSTGSATWVAAGALGVAGLLAWLPSANAATSSQAVVAQTNESNVLEAMSLVEGTLLPCDPSTKVAAWMTTVAPSEGTINAVYSGALANDRCYALITASANFALQLKQADRAVAYARQGVDIDPLNFQQWLLLARALQANGDAAGATEALERALALAPASQAEIEQVSKELGLPWPAA